MYPTDTISISTNNKTLYDNLTEQLTSLGYTCLARETKTTEIMALSTNDKKSDVTAYSATFNKQEDTCNESAKREMELSKKTCCEFAKGDD